MPIILANIITYFWQSNLAGQLIVACLIVFSVLAWAVMLGKYMDLKRMRELNFAFERQLSELDLVLRYQPRSGAKGPYAYLTREAVEAYHRARTSGSDQPGRIAHVENALHRAVAQSLVRYESKMVLLGSIVTGAPFMGLLGTVWGVMDAFGGIATETAATIQMLAPGVSGALLTTVAGLLVAIPSVFGYNYLLSESKIMVTELENFASTLADRIELESREQEAQYG